MREALAESRNIIQAAFFKREETSLTAVKPQLTERPADCRSGHLCCSQHDNSLHVTVPFRELGQVRDVCP